MASKVASLFVCHAQAAVAPMSPCLFFNPEKYFKRTSVSLLDRLLDDLFSSDMDIDLRARNRVSIEPLLKDLSKIMDFLHEEEDDWFFDL